MIHLTRDEHRLLQDTHRGQGRVYTTGTATWHTTTRPLGTPGQWRAPANRADRDIAKLVDLGLVTPRRTAGEYTPTRAGERYLNPPSLTQIVERARLAVRARGTLSETLSVALNPILDSIDDLPATLALLTGDLIPCRLCPDTPVYDPTGFAQHHLSRHATRIITTRLRAVA